MALRQVPDPDPDPATTPTFTGSVSGYVRELLMTGAVIEVDKIAAELGMERERIRHAVGNVRQGGLAVDRVGKLGEGRYRLGKASRVGKAGRGGGKTAPAIGGPRAQDVPTINVDGEGEQEDDASLALAPRGRRKVKVTEAPMLGARLKVVALALERGDVVARLEGDGEVWTAVLRK